MRLARCSGPGTNEGKPDIDGGKTNAALLDQVRDWGSDLAWTDFFERYDGLMRKWCRRLGIEGDLGDELCQRIWIELMQRIQTFRYDPGLGFRGWLWRLFRCRAIDLLRQESAARMTPLQSLDREASEIIFREPEQSDQETDAAATPAYATLCDRALEAQLTVRSRVDPDTWRAFWMIAIEDRTVREVAESLGKTYTAVYTGYKRVDRMLRNEGTRRLAVMAGAASGLPGNRVAREVPPGR